MKLSSKALACGQSPMRKFHPYAVAAAAAGKKIYHLNIGQPDVKTPESFYQAVREFREPTLEYAPASGLPAYIDAVRGYYAKLGVKLEREDILATSGGGEALEFIMACILDDGDELLVPEPFYANYNTFTFMSGGVIHPIPTSADNGYRFADRELIESQINERTRAILVTNPGNPTGLVLTHEEMRVIADVVKEHDLFLVADEVYREFIYDDEPMGTFCEMEDIKDHVIVVDSISKRFSACGARIGCMIPGTKFHTPDGAFYMMVTLPVDDVEKLQYFLLEEFEDNGDTVMYAPGSGFYADPADGRSEIRIAYVHNCDYLRRAIQLLGKGIAAYNAKRGA